MDVSGAHRRPLVAGCEVLLAAAVVLLDLAIPALVIVALAGLSLALRHDRPASLGFHRLARPGRTVGLAVAVTLAWTTVQFCLVMPLLNRLTGTEQDLSGFADLEGNAGLLLVLVALSWTLAALGEEAAFRGYLLTRATELGGVVFAVALSSVLFGLLHTEQGLVGVVLSALDAVVFAALRLWSGSVWTSVVSHGTSNTVGLVAAFLLGPVHGLW